MNERPCLRAQEARCSAVVIVVISIA
jgi:hypothetical protein